MSKLILIISTIILIFAISFCFWFVYQTRYEPENVEQLTKQIYATQTCSGFCKFE